MREKSPDKAILDDRLADHTDRLLDNHAKPPIQAAGAELQDLMQTVNFIHNTIQPQPPDPAMAERMLNRLHGEWRKANPPTSNKAARRTPTRLSRRIIAWSLAGAALVLLIISMFLIPGQEAAMPATATGSSTLFSIIILFVVIAGGILWWLHKKDKGG